MIVPSLKDLVHPISYGTIFCFCGVEYRCLGAACRLFDRESLPHPCCTFGYWKGRQWSYRSGWRRGVGCRFVVDKDAVKHPSYYVENLSIEGGLRIKTFWSISLSKYEVIQWHKNSLNVSAEGGLTFQDLTLPYVNFAAGLSVQTLENSK